MGSERLTELLATGIAQLVVEVNRESQTQCFNWLFPAWCSAQPLLPLKITNLTSANSINTGWIRIKWADASNETNYYRMEYLPESVNSYINKTWEEGRDVAYDLYDDIKEEVISKSDVHVDAMTKMMERFFERANEIHSSIKTVLEQEGALTDEEIREIADKEGLQQLREKFTDLEEELEREAVEGENLPEGVERMLQGMIRLCRQMMAAAADKEAEFWSKMKQLEVQFYQMKSASADTAASLRDWVTAAFQTMNEIDLNAIGGSSDKLVDEPRAN